MSRVACTGDEDELAMLSFGDSPVAVHGSPEEDSKLAASVSAPVCGTAGMSNNGGEGAFPPVRRQAFIRQHCHLKGNFH